MATQPRSPSEHYREAERLLAVAESTGTDLSVQTVAALASIGHALLAAAPRKARRSPRPPAARHTATDQWMFGGGEQ